ncbi:hypothetical protein ACVDG3_22130 [Meridianimarinicoccus sp. RP-17]
MILRSGLLLLISGIVYNSHSAADAAAFFQILYLQATAIAFLSASGFFRVQSIDTDEGLTEYLAATALLIPPSALLPVLVAFLVPEYTARLPELAIAWIGAIATALAAPVSGIVLKRRGPLAAFLPACIAALLAMVVLIAAGSGELHTLAPYLALCGFQVITVLLLLLQIRTILATTLRRLAHLGSGMPFPHLQETSAVGALNVLSMLLVFGIRQLWVQKAGADIGAAVLLTLRISDSVLQLTHMVMAGHQMATRLIRSHWSLLAQVGSVCVSILLILLLGQLTITPTIPVIVFAVLAQIALDVSRIPWSFGFLYQMKQFHLLRYAVFTLCQPAIGFTVAIWPILQGRPEGLLIFLAISVASGAIISTLQGRRSRENSA